MPGKKFSLSNLYDALEMQKGGDTKQSSSYVDMSLGIRALKTLKGAPQGRLTLFELAKEMKIKAPACQEVCQQLDNQGLVKITPEEIGNDTIEITKAGTELV